MEPIRESTICALESIGILQHLFWRPSVLFSVTCVGIHIWITTFLRPQYFGNITKIFLLVVLPLISTAVTVLLHPPGFMGTISVLLFHLTLVIMFCHHPCCFLDIADDDNDNQTAPTLRNNLATIAWPPAKYWIALIFISSVTNSWLGMEIPLGLHILGWVCSWLEMFVKMVGAWRYDPSLFHRFCSSSAPVIVALSMLSIGAAANGTLFDTPYHIALTIFPVYFLVSAKYFIYYVTSTELTLPK